MIIVVAKTVADFLVAFTVHLPLSIVNLGVFHLHSVSSGVMRISCIVPLALSIPHDDLCSHINLGLITQLQVCYYQSSFFIIASYKLYKKSGMYQCQHLNPLSLSLF